MNRHKYNVSPPDQRTYKGRVYHSKAEMIHATTLDLDNAVAWWGRQVPFDLGEDHRYIADFLVQYEDGNQLEVHEVKGRETPAWRKTKQLWRKYGTLPLRVITRGRTVEIIRPQE